MPRTSLPPATPVQRAAIGTAVRRAVSGVSTDLPTPWESTLRAASLGALDEITDALDAAVSATDLRPGRTPWWWPVAGALQWLLFGVAVVGACWLAALAAVGFLGAIQPTSPRWLGLPVPTWLLVGGLVLGWLLALTGRLLGRLWARRRARRAERRLHSAVAEVVDARILAPISAEVDAYRSCRSGLAVALRA